MTRAEVIRKLEEALIAIQQYKRDGLDRASFNFEKEEIQRVLDSSRKLIVEAKTIGAAGQTCPACNGSGRL